MIGEYRGWVEQVNASLAEVNGRLSALEARVERLDTHSGEMAREMLDLITRVDVLEERLTERARGLEDRLLDLEQRMGAAGA